MERLLLVVESAHHVSAIGTILSPLLPIGAVSAPAQAEVTLKRQMAPPVRPTFASGRCT
jgi:hypothetical protein